VFKFRKLFVDILNFRKLYNLNNENSIEVSSLDLQQKTSNNVSFSILLGNCIKLLQSRLSFCNFVILPIDDGS